MESLLDLFSFCNQSNDSTHFLFKFKKKQNKKETYFNTLTFTRGKEQIKI